MSRNNWMSSVATDVRINRLPIPGTHDSGARHYIAGHDYDQCQDKSYLDQLEMGVRFLDIRLVHVQSNQGGINFAVHHGPDYQWSYFDKDSDYSNNPDCTEFVLQDCFDFLDRNPTECIVMSIKQEKPEIDPGAFEDAFMDLLKRSPRWPQRFWVDNYVPAVVMAQGRIVIANRIATANQPGHPYVGIPWPNWDKAHVGDGVDVEDHYQEQLTSGKWGYVKDHLVKALAAGVEDPNWFITFNSNAPGNASPQAWADDMNPLLVEHLKGVETVAHHSLGIVVMDFVPQEAVDLLISLAQRTDPRP